MKKKEKNLTSYQKILLARSSAYKTLKFTVYFSKLLVLLFLVLIGVNFYKNNSINLFYLIIALTNLCVFGLASWLKLDVIKHLKETEDLILPNRIKNKSLLLIPFVLVNPAALISTLIITNDRNQIVFTMSYLTAFITTFIFILSSFNLLKNNVSTSQYIFCGLLLIISVIQWLLVVVVSKKTNSGEVDASFKTIGFIYLAFTLTGSIFSLLLGVIILISIKNLNNSKEVYWISIIVRIFKNPVAVAGLVFILFLFQLSLTSGFTFDYNLAVKNDYDNLFQEPSLKYLFGTDNYGRDVYVRVVFGAKISLTIGILATLVPLFVGGFLGAIAGYFGKNTDNIIMRLLDVLYAIPGILLAIAIIAAFGANAINLVLALSVGSIPIYARLVRAQVLQLSNVEFVEAAKSIGASNRTIIFSEIIPNSLSPVIVNATLGIGAVVLSTSAMSFLGLGVQEPTPEWGNVLKSGSDFLESAPYLAIFPGIAIMLIVLAFNFFGDGLRDALDPKLK